MSDLNSNVPFEMFGGVSNREGIGFRVIATGYNHCSITARNPEEAPTFASVDNHLSWRHQPTPWVSVFTTWFAALNKARFYTNQGAQEVSIVVIDLDKVNYGTLSAVDLNAHISGSVPQWYAHEFLIHRGTDEDAVVAYIPAAGDYIDIEVHLERIRVPQQVINEAGGNAADDINRWVGMEVYSRTGIWDAPMTLRVMQSLCVNRWDDV